MADRVVNDMNTQLDRLAQSTTSSRQKQVCPITSRLDHLRDLTSPRDSTLTFASGPSLCSVSCADSVPQTRLEAQSELLSQTRLHLCVESAEAWLVKVTLTHCQSHSELLSAGTHELYPPHAISSTCNTTFY